MIQHHLIYHYTSYDEGVTYYEPNPQAAYYLVRSGKILAFIQDRLGKYAATVMSTIMFLGHAQISHLETLPELKSGQLEADGINDDLEGEGAGERVNGHNVVGAIEQPALLHPTLKALASHGYLIRVRDAQFQSYADNALDAERAIKSRPDVKQMKGKRLEETVLEGTLAMLREKLDGDLTRGLMHNGLPRGAKRRPGSGSADKSARMDYDMEDEAEEENEWSDDDMGGDATPMEVKGSPC